MRPGKKKNINPEVQSTASRKSGDPGFGNQESCGLDVERPGPELEVQRSRGPEVRRSRDPEIWRSGGPDAPSQNKMVWRSRGLEPPQGKQRRSGGPEVRMSGGPEATKRKTNKQKKVQRSASPVVRMSGGLEAPMKKIIPAKHPNSGTQTTSLIHNRHDAGT